MIKFKELKQDLKGLISKNEPKYERAPTEDPEEIEAQRSSEPSSSTNMTKSKR